VKREANDERRGTVVQVAAGLVMRDGRYLITKRKAGVHLEGLWEFPGGKREASESLEECLHRELREELGIEVEDSRLFQIVRHAYPEQTVELHFFHCRYLWGEAKALGCESLAWVRPENIWAYEFPPADRPVVDALKKGAYGM
jgi:mutator protein MutT